MSSENNTAPIIWFNLSQRDNPEEVWQPGEDFAPIIFQEEVAKHVASKDVVYFDAAMNPCEDINKSMYIYHRAEIAPPMGFSIFGEDNRPTTSEWTMQAQNYAPIPTFIPATPIPPQTTSSGDPEKNSAKDSKKSTDDKENTAKLAEKLTLEEQPDGYYILSSKTLRHTRASNFLVSPVTITRFEKVDQGECRRTIEFEIRIFGKGRIRKVNLTIPYEELKDLLTIISTRNIEAIQYAEGRGTLIARFPELIRQKLGSTRQITVYQSSGWQQLENGTFAYVHDGATPPSENIRYQCGFGFGLPVTPFTPAQGLSNVWQLLEVANPKVNILVPVLFSHMACLYELFSMAGCPPHMLLFIQGISGSLKTAVASLIFNFSAQKEYHIPATFRDTSASMEVKMGQFGNRVLLVDDFCPAASGMSKQMLQQTLEQLVRFYGDGIGKSRTNPRLEEVYEKKPHGLCAITGEDVSGSYSSLLRCLFLEIDKGCFDGNILSHFQEDPTQWTGHLHHFVTDCQCRVPHLVKEISLQFPEYRKRGERHIKERRLIDAYAQLTIVAGIFLNYALRHDPMLSEEGATALHAQMEQEILTLCQRSERQAVESNPAKIFASILMDAIRLDTVKLGSVQEAEANPSAFLGVIHQGYWCLWPQKTYSLILNQYRQEGSHFPLSQASLWQTLAHAGILIPAPQKSKGTERVEYGTRMSFLDRPRLLKISPEMLQRVEND